MAKEFCTQEEIARALGFDKSAFAGRAEVAAAYRRGRNAARMSLRHMMYDAARGGNTTMMIFLAKNELHYRDNPEPRYGFGDAARVIIDV